MMNRPSVWVDFPKNCKFFPWFHKEQGMREGHEENCLFADMQVLCLLCIIRALCATENLPQQSLAISQPLAQISRYSGIPAVICRYVF
jgi:hypothetical protein